MDEYIQNDEQNERRKKQEYLIKNVIQTNYDPEAFSEFLSHEKRDGQDIDNWNIEELETMVGLFKKFHPPPDKESRLALKLEEIELNDDERSVYAKRIETVKKRKTLLGDQDVYILIPNVEVLDGGLFYGKSLCFHLETPQIDARVRRTEAEFRWLQDSLAAEFPATPLPPLVRLTEKFTEPGVLGQYKRFFEKHLNECARHPELRNSAALESFLTCQSKEEFALKTKEVERSNRRSVLFDKNCTKKMFDDLGKDVLKALPTAAGFVDVKISQVLKRHFAAVDGQFHQYDAVFDRIEKLAADYGKCYAKLLAANKRMRDCFLELQSTAIKYNSAKDVKLRTNLVEDAVFGSLSTYFNNYGALRREDHRGAAGRRRPEHRGVLPVHARVPRQRARVRQPAQLRLQRVLPAQDRAEREEEQEAAAGQPALGGRARDRQEP